MPVPFLQETLLQGSQFRHAGVPESRVLRAAGQLGAGDGSVCLTAQSAFIVFASSCLRWAAYRFLQKMGLERIEDSRLKGTVLELNFKHSFVKEILPINPYSGTDCSPADFA